MTEVYIGNPPQPIMATFDTGSTNAYVMGPQMHQTLATALQPKLAQIQEESGVDLSLEENNKVVGHFYDNTVSITAKNMNKKSKSQFGAGELIADLYADDFRIGKPEGKGQSIVVKEMPIGSVSKCSFMTGKPGELEGVIGMAYKSLGDHDIDSLAQYIQDQKAARNALFSFYYPNSPAKQAEVTFGYYDKSKMKGDIHWVPVIDKYMYMLKLDDIKINGNPLNICKDKPDNEKCMITIDSGSPADIFPPWAAQSLSKLSYPTHDTAVDCESGPTDIGDITFVIGGKDYTYTANEWLKQDTGSVKSQKKGPTPNVFGPKLPSISSSELMQLEQSKEDEGTMAGTISPDNPQFELINQLVEADIDEQMGNTKSAAPKQVKVANKCKVAFDFADIGKGMFLLGHKFMAKYYTIFDRENNRVGIAQSIDS